MEFSRLSFDKVCSRCLVSTLKRVVGLVSRKLCFEIKVLEGVGDSLVEIPVSPLTNSAVGPM